MLFEIFIILLLVVLNGLLAMSELAIVSARKIRLRTLAARGNRRAHMALRLAEDPGRFLSTVQIGITLVGVLAGAFSGATLGLRLAEALLSLGMPAGWAGEIGVGLVVVAITYLTLIVGELVPKQIALSNPEAVAMAVAPYMRRLAQAARPFVWLLDRSGKAALRLLGQSGARPSGISDDEIHMLIAEAEGAGVIERGETEMITGVMRIADRAARGLMTPHHEVIVAGADQSRDAILELFRSSTRSRLPLRKGGPDEIVGVLHSRDLLQAPVTPFSAEALAKPAPIIPDTLPAMDVIDRLKTAPGHMLLVYDEYGHFAGIVTPMDILGAIAGGFDLTGEDEPDVVERADGSLLVAGGMPVDEFADRLGLEIEANPGYETVAGLVLDRSAELPKAGQSLTLGDWVIEVVDLDGRRIDKLLVKRLHTPGQSEG